MTKATSKIEKITPEIAAKLLKNNPKNRRIKEKNITRLVKSIKQGNWQVNGEAITIANDGTIINGQHRLTAVVIAKTPIETFVARGVNRKAISTVDIGAARTCGDYLSIKGYKGAVHALAAAVVVCMAFKDGSYQYGKERASPDETESYIEKNKGILNSYGIFTENRQFQELLPQSISIALHHLFKEIDREKAEIFFHKLVEGVDLGKTSPILKLRNELINMRKESKRAHWSRAVFIHYTCAAFDSYLNDKRVDSLPEYNHETKIKLPKGNK